MGHAHCKSDGKFYSHRHFLFLTYFTRIVLILVHQAPQETTLGIGKPWPQFQNYRSEILTSLPPALHHRFDFVRGCLSHPLFYHNIKTTDSDNLKWITLTIYLKYNVQVWLEDHGKLHSTDLNSSPLCDWASASRVSRTIPIHRGHHCNHITFFCNNIMHLCTNFNNYISP